jgi:hypothetical protein
VSFKRGQFPHLTVGGTTPLAPQPALTTGGKPKLSSVVLTSEAYGVPPGAEQKGTGSLLDSGDLFPSAAFTPLAPGSNGFGTVRVGAPGSTNYDPNATRWGDYWFAVMDASGKSVWLATEYVPPISSQTPDGGRNWGTRVMNVSAP